MRSKIFSKIKYPKFLLLFFTFLLAYLLFAQRNLLPFDELFLSLGYLGVFLAGLFYVYGFTAGPATAILLVLASEQNILIAGLVAGLGALIGDFIIFRFLRYCFADEIKKLSREKIFLYLKSHTPELVKKYFIPVLAGGIIASPLPDEIGVSLLAVGTKISSPTFSLISYLLNTTGIFIILIIGKLI